MDQAKVDQPLQKMDRRDQIRARVQDRVAPVAPVVDLVQSQALVLVVQVAADPVEVVLVAPVAAAEAPGLALRAKKRHSNLSDFTRAHLGLSADPQGLLPLLYRP